MSIKGLGRCVYASLYLDKGEFKMNDKEYSELVDKAMAKEIKLSEHTELKKELKERFKSMLERNKNKLNKEVIINEKEKL